MTRCEHPGCTRPAAGLILFSGGRRRYTCGLLEHILDFLKLDREAA